MRCAFPASANLWFYEYLAATAVDCILKTPRRSDGERITSIAENEATYHCYTPTRSRDFGIV
jgi:hypothetical protein